MINKKIEISDLGNLKMAHRHSGNETMNQIHAVFFRGEADVILSAYYTVLTPMVYEYEKSY